MKILFAGTPHFAARALEALLKKHQILAVLTQPDRPSGRGMQVTASPVKQLAQQHGITILQPSTLKNEEVQASLVTLGADVMVVAAYGLILPQSVLKIPHFGCLNIHASLLPRWRGAAPIQRAILAGDIETGITIMQMDVGLDTGDMLLKKTCSISSSETAQTLHSKLAELGAQAIVEALQQIECGQICPEKQKDEFATYAVKLTKGEASIDWTADAVELDRAVRGYFPFPVAVTKMRDTSIKIISARLVADQSGESGTVISVDKKGILVAAGRGSLRLENLQKPGGKVLPVIQFIQSFPIKVGDRFGEQT